MIDLICITRKAYALFQKKRLKLAVYFCVKNAQTIISIITTLCSAEIISQLSSATLDGITVYIIALIASYILQLLFSHIAFNLREFIEKNTRIEVKEKLLHDFLFNDIKDSSINRLGSARITEIIYSDSNNITTIVFAAIDLMTTILFVIISGIVILSISFGLSAIIIASHIIWLAVALLCSKTIKRIDQNLREKTDEHFRMVRDIIKNSKYLRASNSSGIHYVKCCSNTDDVKNYTIFRDKRVWVHSQMNKAHGYLWIILILSFGIYCVSNSILSGTSIIMYISYAGKFSQNLMQTLNIFFQLQNVFVSVERVFELLEEEKCDGNVQYAELPCRIRSIAINDLTYVYQNVQYPAITNLNHETKSNLVLVVGKNGSGKTTLLNLITGNLNLQQGDILYNGISQRELSLTSLRKGIAYFIQDAPLMDLTIRESILSFPDSFKVNDEDIWGICKRIGLYDDLMSLPQGMETKINEIRMLSAGQKRKIELARVLLMPSKMLVLDEPLMGVDIASQQLIVKCLSDLSKSKLVIVVTHKPDLFPISVETIKL